MKSIASVEDIRTCYRLVLGRESDPAGLDHFTRLASSGNLTAPDIALLLTQSEEFAVRGGRLGLPVEVQMDGYFMFARPGDRDIGHALAKGGAYEPHVTAVVRRELHAGDVFLDVGANIGYFSMLAAHLVGASGKVVSVEPLDKNLQLIYAGILRNGFDHVEVFPFGASDGSKIVAMVTDPGTSNALIQSAPSNKATSFFIPTRTLDSITAHLDRIDLVKMDIEGHEIFAWHGAQSMLARCRPRILTEFHPLAMRENAGIDYHDYLALLFGYAKHVSVVMDKGELVSCSNSEQVMTQWEKNDKRYGGNGTSHLDLFVNPK